MRTPSGSVQPTEMLGNDSRSGGGVSGDSISSPTICEKISTRWPSRRNLGRSLSRSTHLPDAARNSLTAAAPPPSEEAASPSAARNWSDACASTPLIK